MALSTRQQWDVLMEEVDRVEQEGKTGIHNYRPCYLPFRPWTPSNSAAPDVPLLNQSAVHLPSEIITHILSYVPRHYTSQATLYSCCLISRQCYAVAISQLYHSPYISGKNFKQFVATVCPSVNAHVRKSELAWLVRRLDMGNLVHDGSKSLTARLLGRVKFHLEEFVAPQASFAVNCLAALSKCMNLRHLDLSLISESIALRDLLHAIMPLTKLVSLCFPRSSTNDAKSNSLFYSWPTNLQKLHLAGGIQDTSLFFFTNMPETLSSLTIEHCPNLTRFFIWGVLPTLSSHLTHLKISYHMAKLSYGYLDGILFKAMNLRSLSISVDYISHKFFVSAGKFSPSHPLEMLELDDSGAADLRLEGRISANRVFFAVSDGGLGNLRRVRVNKRLGWQESPEGREDVEDLNDLLEVKAREDAVMAVLASGTLGPTSEAGVWVFE